MNDPVSRPGPDSTPSENAVIFALEGSHTLGNNGRNWLPWVIAVTVIAVLAGLAFLLGGHHDSPNGSSSSNIDPYAAQLAISNIQISQATNFAGGQITYVDGTIANHGNRTVTSVTVQVLFANNEGEQPQSLRLSLNLIRTRQPYVDIEPVSAAPLKPGDSQDFRLIFEDVSPIWNQQIPDVKVQSVVTKH